MPLLIEEQALQEVKVAPAVALLAGGSAIAARTSG
jgi:hypothetical protein